MLKKLLIVIPVILLGAVFGYFVLLATKKSFPQLPVGVYFGEIKEKNNDKLAYKLFLEVDQKNSIQFRIYNPERELRSEFAVQHTTDSPLLISDRNVDYVFIGDSKTLTGEVELLPLKQKYNWSIRKVVDNLTSSDGSNEDLLTWSNLKKEYILKKKALDETQDSIQKTQIEFDQLTNLLSDPKKFKDLMESKLSDLKVKFTEIKELIYLEQDNEVELEKKLQKVRNATQYGQLVRLARETLKKESEIIHKQLSAPRFEPQTVTAEFGESDFVNPSQVDHLKAAVSREQDLIFLLKHKLKQR